MTAHAKPEVQADNNLQAHFLENGIIVIDLKWHAKVEHDIRSITAHITLNDRCIVGVDHDKWQWDLLLICPSLPTLMIVPD